MGKGDKKSRKGKIFMGTYGVTRPRKTAELIVIPKEKKTAAIKKEEVATKVGTQKKTETKKTVAKKK